MQGTAEMVRRTNARARHKGRGSERARKRDLNPLRLFTGYKYRSRTSTGQNQGISHGLQIGKDQDDSSQDADHDGYQFNNIGFIDDISIFAETPEGMQTLLDVVQEFTTWCGMEINVKKNSYS